MHACMHAYIQTYTNTNTHTTHCRLLFQCIMTDAGWLLGWLVAESVHLRVVFRIVLCSDLERSSSLFLCDTLLPYTLRRAPSSLFIPVSIQGLASAMPHAGWGSIPPTARQGAQCTPSHAGGVYARPPAQDRVDSRVFRVFTNTQHRSQPSLILNPNPQNRESLQLQSFDPRNLQIRISDYHRNFKSSKT